ncbi:MAG TPA: hypothetical protein VMI92_10475 [Steroidobacteraceae bacterium]|nr:hypothetical protein [Steroidobacteraceae bacterium]
MKAAVTVSLLAALVAGPAFASCEAPNTTIKVPSGETATKDEMLVTQRAIKDLDAATKVYETCLQQDSDAAVAAAGDKATDEDKNKIATPYVQKQNAAVDKVKAIADSFNAELKIWRAKNQPAAAAPAK